MWASSPRGLFNRAVYLIKVLPRSNNDEQRMQQEENIFQPSPVGGLGFTRPDIIIQGRKLSLMKLALNSSDNWTRWAIEALLRQVVIPALIP